MAWVVMAANGEVAPKVMETEVDSALVKVVNAVQERSETVEAAEKAPVVEVEVAPEKEVERGLVHLG